MQAGKTADGQVIVWLNTRPQVISGVAGTEFGGGAETLFSSCYFSYFDEEEAEERAHAREAG